MIEDADQAKQGRVGRRLIPMIENDIAAGLAPDRADDRAEDHGHPQQHGQASNKAGAAKRGESNQDARSQDEANERLGRPQFSRSIRKLCQNLSLLRSLLRVPHAKLSQQRRT